MDDQWRRSMTAINTTEALMRVTWLYSGDDGESHIAELKIPDIVGLGGGRGTAPLPAQDVFRFAFEDAVQHGFDPAPQRPSHVGGCSA
jgi:hypothetical protein